ncbi:uncharacterized protein METZ01_LOCUS325083, partial [marine metagenome]
LVRGGAVLLERKQRSAKLNLPVGLKIGKTLLPGAQKPDPIYLFTWKDPQKSRNWPAATLNVTLERVTPSRKPEQGLSSEAEQLRITAVSGEVTVGGENIQIGLDDVDLKLHTLEDGVFWMDEPGFTVRWDAYGEDAVKA